MTLVNSGSVYYPKLSYKIVGVCFEAHNQLGRFAREKQYGNEIEKLLKEKEIRYEREFAISDTANIVDFLVEEKVILELKTKRIITKTDYYQVQRYLQSTGIKLAILVNFQSEYLTPKRIILKDN